MQLPSDTTAEQTVNLFPEVDLKIYARILWNWTWLIILCVFMAAASAYIVSNLSIPIYQASSTLLIDEARNPTSSYQDLLSSERIARTYAELMQRKQVLRNLAASLGLEPDVVEAALTNINVTPVRDTQLVRVQVEGVTPEFVQRVANELPQVFIQEINNLQTQQFGESRLRLETQLNELRGQIELANAEMEGFSGSRTVEEDIRFSQLRDELAQYQASYTSLLGRYEELRLIELQSTDSITVVEEAELPQAPIRPRTLVNTLLAAIVGGMLALGVIFLIEYLDDRIRTPQDLYTVLDAPILGTIAQMKRMRRGSTVLSPEEALVVATQPRHPIAESFRRLRTNLRFSSVNEPLRTLLVTSAVPSEGKTTTTANLATAVSQAGHKVVVVDADLRKPQIHKLFQLSKGPGLTDALLSDGEISFFLRDTGVPNLQVITCGSIPPNPAELLGSKPMQQLLERLEQEADFVFIDAPPLLAVTDAQILSSHAQGVLLVINTAKTSRALVANAASTLVQVEARLLGVVLNQLTRSGQNSYYYYDAYAGYYTEDEVDDGATTPTLPAESITPATKPKPKHQDVQEKQLVDEAFQLKGTNGVANGYYQLNSTESNSSA